MPSSAQRSSNTCAFAKGETEEQRTAEGKEKTGVFTGAYAINPVNGARIPIWIADYVLMGYGTGAIMAVPAHDQRDFDFARKFDLPVKVVVMPPDRVIDGDTDGTSLRRQAGRDGRQRPHHRHEHRRGWQGTAFALRQNICEAMGFGKRRVNYRIRPWLISRQRYWGTPIPSCTRPMARETLSESELPVLLPEVKDYEPGPNGESPLATIPEFVQCAERPARDRHDGDLGLLVVVLHALCRSAQRSAQIGKPEQIDYWLPVDMYVGGAEHAVLHLLYARMWTKVLYDIGAVKFIEPFKALRNQGMILSPPEEGRREGPRVLREDEQVEGQRDHARRSDCRARRGRAARLRDVHQRLYPDRAVEHAGRAGRAALAGPRVAHRAVAERGQGRAGQIAARKTCAALRIKPS